MTDQAAASKEQRETRQFRMDPALLWSVILMQAGTPEKALLEGIMNAVDARATRCEISIDLNGYQIKDDGDGFRSRRDIDEFFETFGTPHEPGVATYGKFRMGRGQLFAFSTTHWRTGSFSMDVDVKGRGLEYDLSCDLPAAPGCCITGIWYERIDLGEQIRIAHDLGQLAQWMQIPVTVNGKKINKSLSEQTWTYETDDAYIAAKASGGLAVYNLGALVRIYPAHQFGLSGILVSKHQLQVNSARNDILLSECRVWRRIRRELDKICGQLTKKKTLQDFERDAIAARFVSGEFSYEDVASLGLITDVSGRKRTLRDLAAAERLCVVPVAKDWTIGERVMNQKLAFVIRPLTLDRFNVATAEELLGLIRGRVNFSPEAQSQLAALHQEGVHLADRSAETWREDKSSQEFVDCRAQINVNEAARWRIIGEFPYTGNFDHLTVIELSEVSAHITAQYDLLPRESLSPHQKAMLKGLHAASEFLTNFLNTSSYQSLTVAERAEHANGLIDRNWKPQRESFERAPRQMIVGKSDVAAAWTDGATFIAVHLDVINDVLSSKKSMSYLTAILFHEYCHEEPDIGGHVHSPDFYERFHDLTCDTWMFESIRTVLLTGYAKAIAEIGKKPNQYMRGLLKADSKLGSAAEPLSV